MSRKTRKLIWSAPLVAVLAVAVALAAFASLSPNGALAQDATMGPPTGVTATANSQTQITLNWSAPAGLVNTYRIDMSDDGDVWEELVSSAGTGPGTSSVVVQNSTGRYVHTGLTAGTTHYYRVYAIFASGGEGEPAAPVMATTLPAIAPAPPTGLATVSGSTDAETIRLTWTPPAGVATGGSAITGYKIEGSRAGGAWQTLEEAFDGDDDTTDDTTIEYDHDKLLEGTAWRYRVSSVNKAGTGLPSDPISGTTADGVPPIAPTGITSQGTNSNAILHWDAVDDQPGAPITGYKIQRKASADNPATADVDESADSQWELLTTTGKGTVRQVGRGLTGFQDSGAADVAWDFRVAAVNSVGTGPYSTAATFSAPDPATQPGVRAVRALPASQTQIDLSWSAPSAGSPSTYSVRASSDGLVWNEIDGSVSTTTYSHTGLKPGQSWQYRVIADGTHQWSPIAYATTRAARAPGAPTLEAANVAANAAKSASQIDLSWTAPVAAMLYGSSITGYKVERSMDRIDWETAAETDDDAVTYMDKGLSPDTTYYYRVRAMTAGGTGNASAIQSAATSAAPFLGIPTGLVAIAKGSSRVDLYWLTPGDPDGAPITGYRIEYSDDDGTTWMDAMADSGSRATMYSHTGRMATTKYTYRVSAINSEATGSPSPDTSAMTTAVMDTTLRAPSGVSASSSAPRQLDLTWEGGENADLYVLVAYDIATGQIQLSTVTDGAARSGNVTGLTPGSQYLGLVIAVKGSGDNLEWEYGYDGTNIVTSQ